MDDQTQIKKLKQEIMQLKKMMTTTNADDAASGSAPVVDQEKIKEVRASQPIASQMVVIDLLIGSTQRQIISRKHACILAFLVTAPL